MSCARISSQHLSIFLKSSEPQCDVVLGNEDEMNFLEIGFSLKFHKKRVEVFNYEYPKCFGQSQRSGGARTNFNLIFCKNLK